MFIKVAVRFPTRFWHEKINQADYFGYVPENVEEKGIFNVFYDLSSKVNIFYTLYMRIFFTLKQVPYVLFV